jgi:hypothetical protein
MRFVAIIGLCLTAVFALVRSLPIPEADDRGPKEEHGPESGALEELRSASGELARLRQEQESVQRVLQQTREQVRELAPLTRELADLRQEREQEERALELARAQIRGLASRNQRAAEEQRAAARELARIEQQIEREQRRFALPPRAVAAAGEPATPDRAAAQGQAAEPANANTEPVRPPRPAAPMKAAPRESILHPIPGGTQGSREGFVLRFASADALDRLVRSGSVEFVGIQGDRAWRLSLADAGPRFSSGRKPVRFHEMTADTVPAGYLRAFARVADLAEPSAVVWGVRLPPSIEDRIGRLTRAAKGGVLVIRGDGRVVLEGNHAG